VKLSKNWSLPHHNNSLPLQLQSWTAPGQKEVIAGAETGVTSPI